ncbi:universal stress protein [Kibdelosporangium lantanae]|uniref:Universal stress protein n=1 Tax=Kibdelosporangium lantanae TaxID=1497396 RepID=A0ABW3MKQ4_9PSEU
MPGNVCRVAGAGSCSRVSGAGARRLCWSHGALTPASAMLGSVTSACLRHARCPVVVIPGKGM